MSTKSTFNNLADQAEQQIFVNEPAFLKNIARAIGMAPKPEEIKPANAAFGWTEDEWGWYYQTSPNGRNLPYTLKAPQWTRDLNAVRELSNWILIHASDIGADGFPLVELSDPSTSPPRIARGIGLCGGPHALTRAWLAAALRARAMECPE